MALWPPGNRCESPPHEGLQTVMQHRLPIEQPGKEVQSDVPQNVHPRSSRSVSSSCLNNPQIPTTFTRLEKIRWMFWKKNLKENITNETLEHNLKMGSSSIRWKSGEMLWLRFDIDAHRKIRWSSLQLCLKTWEPCQLMSTTRTSPYSKLMDVLNVQLQNPPYSKWDLHNCSTSRLGG